MIEFRFYIEYNNEAREVFPLWAGMGIEWSESKEFFEFEKTLSNNLTFTNKSGDYDYLINIIKTNEVKIHIHRNNKSIFIGYFSILIAKVDEHLKTIEVKPREESDEQILIDNWEIEHNLLDIAEKKTLSFSYVSEIQFTTGMFADASGFVAIKTVSDGYIPTSIFAREWCAIKPDDTWTEETSIWGSAYTKGFVRSYTHLNPNLPDQLKISNLFGVNRFVGTLNNVNYYVLESNLKTTSITNQVDNGISLEQALKYLFSKFSELTLKSSFFFNDNDEFDNVATNYIENHLDLTKLILYQITDVKKYDSSQNAQKLTSSLKDLHADLKVLFGDVRFFIDRNNCYRIEHKDYFDRFSPFILDCRTLSSSLLIEKMKSWSVNTSESYRYEKLQYATAIKDSDTVNVINISNLALTDNSTKATKQIVADFENVLLYNDKFSDDYIVALIYNSNNEIVKEDGVYNKQMNLENLYSIYTKSERVTNEYQINETTHFANSLKKNKYQEDIVIPLSFTDIDLADFNPFYYRFFTFLSEESGEAYNVKYDFETDTLTIKLRYEL